MKSLQYGSLKIQTATEKYSSGLRLQGKGIQEWFYTCKIQTCLCFQSIIYAFNSKFQHTKIDFGNITEIRKLITFGHFIANKKPT